MSNPVAQQFLKAAVESARGDGALRLPSVNALARACGVSRMTMWKAVHELAVAGVLVVRHGSGIYLGDSPAPAPGSVPERGGCRWERVKARITRDILAGMLRTRRVLPSGKELGQHYGVHPRTLRTALRELEREGLIEKQRSQYAIVRPPARRAGRSTLVLVLPEDFIPLIQWSYYTNAVQLFVSLLEHECDSRGIALVRRTYSRALREVKLLRNSLGCIFWVGGNESEADGFFRALPLVDRPLSIIDYWFRFALPPGCINARNSLMLTVDEHDAMVRLGQYVLQQGHRRVAYFRCSEDAAWTGIRIAGIRSAFRSAGVDEKEIVVFDSRPSTTRRFSEEKATSVYNSLVKTVERRVNSPVLRASVASKLYEARSFAAIEHRTLRSFEEAARRTDLGAWICESDALAVYGALPFLRSRRIPLSRRPSVVAFGDSPEASCDGLTIVVQRMDLCLEEVMRHTLHPSERGGRREYRKIRIPNTIVVRET